VTVNPNAGAAPAGCVAFTTVRLATEGCRTALVKTHVMSSPASTSIAAPGV
jgi:hypothetical protein